MSKRPQENLLNALGGGQPLESAYLDIVVGSRPYSGWGVVVLLFADMLT